MFVVMIMKKHKNTTLKPTPNEPTKNYFTNFCGDCIDRTNFTRMKLRLPLKTEWFEMSEPDGKTEDYRDINEYWFKRLVFQHKKVFKYTYGFNIDLLDKQTIEIALSRIVKDSVKVKMIGFKKFTSNVMTLGYPKSTDLNRIKEFEHLGIEIGYGKPEWGAEANKLYFIIKHGKRL